MGVYIRPCRGCPLRDGCEQRDEWRDRVGGLGLRSATIRCGKLSAELRLGRRIEIDVPHIVASAGGPEDAETVRRGSLPVKATIVGARDDQFSCVVDPGQPGVEWEGVGRNVRFRRTLPARRIRRFLSEPDAALCASGRVQRDGSCDRPEGEPCHCAEWSAP